MNDQYARQLFSGGRGTYVITANRGITLGRGNTFISGKKPFIILRDLLGKSVIRAQTFPDTQRREPTNRVFLRRIEEGAPGDLTMHVTIKQVEEFLRKISRFLSFHGGGAVRTN